MNQGLGGILLAALSPAVDGLRVSLHVLAASVWVGGQLTLAGLVPTARSLGEGAPRSLARAFARVQWPAYVVLVGTGVWNITAVASGQGPAWWAVLSAKLGVVALGGFSAWLHSRSRSAAGLAAWGAVSAVSSIAALVMGVFLAG